MSNNKGVKNQTIGLIGLGLMGKPMASQLHAAGATLRVWNRDKNKSVGLAAEHDRVEICETVQDVTSKSEITILMLTDAKAVDAVVFGNSEGAEGAIENLTPGSILLDMGTTSVLKTREFSERVKSIGAHWVDAPVSGGTTAAEAGNLTIMVGAESSTFRRVLPWLETMGERITHVGGVGAGQIAKSANQMIVGLTIGAVAEAFTLARHNGVEPAKIREALFGGFAHSRVLELHGERMIKEDYQARAKCSIQRKDISEALELAKSVNLSLPGLETNLSLWDYMVENKMGDLDHSALLLALDIK